MRGMGCSEVERKEFEECLEKRFSVDMILKRIHVFRCHEVTELLACLDHVPEFVKEHPKVKLVVIDSIPFHFRQDFDDMALRASILAKTTNNLMSLAKKYDLAVVTINQATTKPGGGWRRRWASRTRTPRRREWRYLGDRKEIGLHT